MMFHNFELLENIRRRAKRGRDAAYIKKDSLTVDEFQGILDMVEEIKVNEEVNNGKVQ